MDKKDHTKSQGVHVCIPPDHLLVGGVAALETVGADGERYLHVQAFGEMPRWTRVGLLQASLDRERDVLKEGW